MKNLTSHDFNMVEKIIEKYMNNINLSLRIPNEEFKLRQKKVQSILKEKNLDIGIFFWYREMPGDGIYLTGYNPTIERASGLISQEAGPIVLTGPEAGHLAKEVGEQKGVEVAFVEEFAIPGEYYEGIKYHSLKDLIKKIADHSIHKIALLTSLSLIPQKLLEMFKKAVTDNVEFIEADDILRDLRYEKSLTEFVCMEQANKIACAAVRTMLCVLKPGMRETQVAAVADFVMKSLGADSYGMETILNGGSRCRTIIGPASNRLINESEIVQIGCSPSYEGYKGISRRTVIIGDQTLRQKKFIDILSEAYQRAEDALKEVVERDLEANYVDLAAREYFAKYEIDGLNMKQFHTYSTAHGTGLTECLEPLVVGPETTSKFGKRVGIMVDVGCYGHPNDEIAGGCVENAFGKDCNKLIKWSDLPVKVSSLVGSCEIDEL